MFLDPAHASNFLAVARYLPATNHKPSRWVVTYDNLRVIVPYSYDVSIFEVGRDAIIRGLDKMGMHVTALAEVQIPGRSTNQIKRGQHYLVTLAPLGA